MGLDRSKKKVFNEFMEKTGLLARLGLGAVIRWLNKGKRSRVSPLTQERVRFEEDVREQFKKLKEKGISIPVFTL